MPRLPRISCPGITFHIVQRGNDRSRTFLDECDFETYLRLLNRIGHRYGTAVHAYVLMSNHVHLLVTSGQPGGISTTMQQVGSAYVRNFNGRYQRTGTLWEGRFRSSPIDSDLYCLACYRYIELNPVRAGIVARPEDYRWSSHRENIGRRGFCLVAPHPSFLALSADPLVRRQRYRDMVNEQLPRDTLRTFRDCTRTGRPMGGDAFVKTIEKQSGIALGVRKPGRPRKRAGNTAPEFRAPKTER